MTLYFGYGSKFTPYQNLSMSNQSQIDFLEQVQDSYGSTQELANVLDMGVEMLFYLEENTFHKQDVQNVVTALRSVTTALRKQD